jgi:hypothetical protein
MQMIVADSISYSARMKGTRCGDSDYFKEFQMLMINLRCNMARKIVFSIMHKMTRLMIKIPVHKIIQSPKFSFYDRIRYSKCSNESDLCSTPLVMLGLR